LILRRKLRPRTDDLKKLRVKPAPTWCTSRSHIAKAIAKLSKIRITTSQSKQLLFKKKNKEDEGCFVCGSPDHWTKKYSNRKGRKPQPEQKTSNMVVSSSGGGTSGYDNLPYVFSSVFTTRALLLV
jgi:hypothetical protein